MRNTFYVLAPPSNRGTCGSSYRLMEGPQHQGCGLCVFACETFHLSLVVHRVVEVDHLPGHLNREERAFLRAYVHQSFVGARPTSRSWTASIQDSQRSSFLFKVTRFCWCGKYSWLIVGLNSYSVSVHESQDPASNFTGKQDDQAGEELRTHTHTHGHNEINWFLQIQTLQSTS